MTLGGSVAGVSNVRIEAATLTEPAVRELIDELDAELTARYPEDGAVHTRLDAADVAPGRGVLLLAWDEQTDEPLGCGAVRLRERGEAEIKRMYVRLGARGRRVGTVLLAALEAEASALLATRLVLETGERQPESLALYRRAGFVPIPRFGEYVDSPLSYCMGKTVGELSG